MFLSKALYQKFSTILYMLQSTYALFFAVVGLDRLFQFSGANWESYFSALVVYQFPIGAAMLLTGLAIAQLAVAVLLLIPYLEYIGMYCATILLLLVAMDLVIAGNEELFVRAALYAVMAVGMIGIIQLKQIQHSISA